MVLRRGPRRGDEGVSEVIGIVVMITLSAGMAAGLFLWIGIGQDPPESTLSVALRSEGPIAANAKPVSITSVSEPTNWDAVALLLDGRALQYDSTLSGNGKFCVKDGGDQCIPTEDWDPATMPLKAGQLLRIRDMNLEGATLKMVQGEEKLLVTKMKMDNQ